MGRAEPVAGLVMDEPGKQGGCVGVGGQPPAGGVLGKSVLCRGPQYVVDDRGMLAGVGLADKVPEQALKKNKLWR